jgi:hypothetical protein
MGGLGGISKGADSSPQPKQTNKAAAEVDGDQDFDNKNIQ